MTDIDRVKQMVQSGRITAAEGEQLIKVLEQSKAADEELQLADQEIARHELGNQEPTDQEPTDQEPAHQEPADHEPTDLEPTNLEPTEQEPGNKTPSAETSAHLVQSRAPLPPALEQPPTSERPPTPTRPPVPEAPPAPPQPGATPAAQPAPTDARWVQLEALAGDLIVTVDESLESPTIKTDGPGAPSIEPSAQGFRVTWNEQTGSFLDKMLGRLKAGNLSMSLPKGYGLDLAASAGNVTLHDVPYLRGHLTAGNLKATRLKGVDFAGRAGNLMAEVELTAGTHQLKVTAGNVNVKLAPNSDVHVKAEASIGDVSSKVPGLKPSNGGLGGSLNGAYGAGAATLDVRVTTGNIDLVVADV